MSNISPYTVGAFVLHITGTVNAYYNVTYFELAKSIGAYASCQVVLADQTSSVQGNKTNFPKLGSVGKLFKSVMASQAKGALMSCKLIQYKATGNKTWFQGKLCTVTPTLQTATGVQAGLNCYCAGKACQLQYAPNSDYINTPAAMAKDISMLQKVGIFSATGLNQAMFAASSKPSVAQLLSRSGSSMDNSILQMIDKNLQALLSFQNTKGGQVAKYTPKVKLSDYFTCNIYPSQVLKMNNYHAKHAYMQSLVQDFINSYTGATILQAVDAALSGQQRMLTFVPPARGQQDKLKLWPSFVQKLTSGYSLQLQDMLSCSITSNPLSHIRTPTYIYVRSLLTPAYDGQKATYARTVGRYALQGASSPYRLKLLDVPGWIVNIIVQSQQRKNAKNNKNTTVTSGAGGLAQPTTLVNKDADVQRGANKENKNEGKFSYDSKQVTSLLDAFAKTIYFHTYMMDKQASIDLAITQKTLDLDKYIGQSLAFRIPVQAKQLGSTGQLFYGRLQGLRYEFKSANSPKAKSSMSVSCTFSAVASADSPAATLYKDDNKTFIYRIGKK